MIHMDWNIIILLLLTVAHAAYAVHLRGLSQVTCDTCKLSNECVKFRAEFRVEPLCKRNADRNDMWLAVVGTIIWGGMLLLVIFV